MLTVTKMFQIIMGIMLSAFILFFLIQYATNYSGFGEEKNRLTIIDNLRHTARDVYFSGNPVVFEDTMHYDFSSCDIEHSSSNSPKIKCDFGELSPLFVPFLFSTGKKEKIILWRDDIDYGWWKEDFVAASPYLSIIFTPEDNSDETWKLMEEIVSSFPSTRNFDVKITFGFCDGDSLLESICGERKCDKDSFLTILRTYKIPAAHCTSALNDGQMLITISQFCAPGSIEKGICIKPISRGLGYVYTPRPEESYAYKDNADILSIIIGKENREGQGTSAESLYEYKNNFFTKKLALAVEIFQRRASILKSEYQERCNAIISPESTYCRCHPIYSRLESTLSDIKSPLSEQYHTSFSYMESLKNKLDDAKDIYQELESNGCEL